ncbi:MAG: hypothetical protein IPL83_05815 [Bdellovibrionales bacterium]|nr:hypothetical protein [Bdellovibrionales bacterium]
MSPKIGKFRKSIWISVCLVAAMAFSTQKARATKIDVMTGYYSITAETATASSEISNFGLYRINYMISLLPKMELIVGYSLMMSDILGATWASGSTALLFIIRSARVGGYRPPSTTPK